MRPLLRILLLCGLPLVVAPSVLADSGMAGRSWELGFAVGSANVDSSSEEFDLDTRFDFRVGRLFTDAWQAELQVASADATFDAHLRALMINGVYSFRTDRPLVPYLLAGAGVAEIDDFTLFGIGEGEEEDGPAYQVGAGVRYFVGSSRRMALRLELSNLWLDLDLFDADRFTSLTAGLTWTFGGR